MLLVFHGEDDYSRAEAIRELRENLGDPETASHNATIIRADDANPAEVFAQASAVPFLSPGRLVVVEGLLAKFEAGTTTGRVGGTRPRRTARGARKSVTEGDTSKLGGWEAVVTEVPSLPASNSLVFSDGEISQSNPLLKLLVPVGEVRRFDRLTGGETVNWVHRRVGELGGQIRPDAANELGQIGAGDLWSLDAELTKLTIYAGDRPVTTEDIAVLGSLVKQESMYALVDAVVEGRYGEARVHLNRILDDPKTMRSWFTMLADQVRRLLTAKDLTNRGATHAELLEGLGTRSDFAARKSVGQANRLSMEDLIEMHERLLQHELAFKTGQMDESTSMELLLTDLCKTAARTSVV